jgi:hypothetical protein
MPNIPSQHRVTMQILHHWQPFRDLKLTFAVSRRAEQLHLRSQQRILATAEDSVLRTEMANLDEAWSAVSGRPFLPPPLDPRSRSLRKCRSRLVVAESFR